MSRSLSAGLLFLLSLPISAQTRFDASGDPLPAGANARLGSQRFRPVKDAQNSLRVAATPDGKIFATLEGDGFRFWNAATCEEIGLVPLTDSRSHSGGIDFSPDGKRFALSEYKFGHFPKVLHSIRVGDMSTRKTLWRLADISPDLTCYQSPIFAAAGKIIVARRDYQSPTKQLGCCLLNAETGKEIGRHDELESYALSNDGNKLALGKGDGMVILLDIATNKELKKINALKGEINAIAWLPDDKRIAVGGKRIPLVEFRASGQVRVLDIDSGSVFRDKTMDGEVTRLALSPDGSLLTAWMGGKYVMWDLQTSKELSQPNQPGELSSTRLPDGTRITIEHHTAGLKRVAAESPDKKPLWTWWTCNPTQTGVVTHDGKSFICGDGELCVVDLQAGKDRADHLGHRYPIRKLSFAPDNSCLISADEHHVFRVWKTADGSVLTDRDEQHKPWAGVRHLDGGKLVFIGIDGTVRVWDTVANRFVRSFTIDKPLWRSRDHVWAPHPELIAGFDTLSRGILACQNKDGLEVWDVLQGKRLTSHKLAGDRRARVSFSPDTRYLLAHSDHNDHNELLLCEATGKELRRWTEKYLEPNLQEPTFSPDSKWLAWIDRQDEQLRCYNIADEKTLSFAGRFYHFAFLSGGSMLAAYDPNKGTLLWNLPKGEEWKCAVPGLKGGDLQETALHTNSEGRGFLSGGWGTRHLDEVVGGRRVVPDFDYRNERLHFSPDGRLVAVAGREVTLYEIASGKPVGKLPRGHRGLVTALAFSADSKTIATGAQEGTILLWDWPVGCGLVRKVSRSLPELWSDLLEADPAKAYPAILALQTRRVEAVALLRKELVASVAAQSQRIRKLIEELGDDHFPVRERAVRDLLRIGLQAEPFLRAARQPMINLDLQKRFDTLLADPSLYNPGPEWLRATRAIQVLDAIGTPEACSIRKELADSPVAIPKDSRP